MPIGEKGCLPRLDRRCRRNREQIWKRAQKSYILRPLMRHAIGSRHHTCRTPQKLYIIVWLTDKIAQKLIGTHGHEVCYGIQKWNLAGCGKSCRSRHHIAFGDTEINVLLRIVPTYLLINLVTIISRYRKNITILLQQLQDDFGAGISHSKLSSSGEI